MFDVLFFLLNKIIFRMSPIFRLGFFLILLTTIMAQSKIDSDLLKVLNGGQRARLQVSLVEGTDEILKRIAEGTYATREDRLTAQQRELSAYAAQTQASVVGVLESEKNRIPITWESLWISNQIIVNGADLQLANAIADVQNVAKIEGEKFVELH